jgi:hypothetical protein
VFGPEYFVSTFLIKTPKLTLSDPTLDLVRDYDFPVPNTFVALTLSNPIFLPPAHSPALIYFGRERVWWIAYNYPTVLKKKN